MQTVTFKKAFMMDVDAATKLTFPEGWTGPVDDDVVELAAEEGCIEGKAKPKAKRGKTVPVDPAAPAGDAPPPAGDTAPPA